MPHPSSHVAPPSPTPLLALVCAAMVRAFDSSWISRPVADLAKEVEVRPERVSRLWRRLLSPMENLLRKASTRGRKRRRRPSRRELRGIRTEALLDVAREVIRLGGVRKRRAKDFLVAARDRLKAEEGVSHREFAEALGLSERTVRSWAARGAAAPEGPAPVLDLKERGSRGVGRFDLSVTLPGLQVVGDTTDLAIFGVPLKVVAFQDPGRRHLTPWESFVVESRENHEIVLDAMKVAVGDRAGMQVVVDQGTPYMAGAVKAACEELDLLHEPQKEGTPTDKATKERQFGVVKHFLGPILGLTQKLAGAVPSLKNVDLARAMGRLLLGTYLRVYVAASAARETNRPDDPVVLEEVARAQRERAVAERRSAKLLLEGIFDRYGFKGSKRDFVRAHRYHFIEDIEEAERRLARQATRGRILHWERYFAGILHNVREGRRVERERQASRKRRAARERSAAEKARREREAHEAALKEDPARRIAQGLSAVAQQYRPTTDKLFNDGIGPGTRDIRTGLEAIADHGPGALLEHAERAWRTFLTTVEDQRPLAAVRHVFERLLAEAKNTAPSPDDSTSAILWPGSRRNRYQRPPPGPDLRNSTAGSGST